MSTKKERKFAPVPPGTMTISALWLSDWAIGYIIPLYNKSGHGPNEFMTGSVGWQKSFIITRFLGAFWSFENFKKESLSHENTLLNAEMWLMFPATDISPSGLLISRSHGIPKSSSETPQTRGERVCENGRCETRHLPLK